MSDTHYQKELMVNAIIGKGVGNSLRRKQHYERQGLMKISEGEAGFQFEWDRRSLRDKPLDRLIIIYNE